MDNTAGNNALILEIERLKNLLKDTENQRKKESHLLQRLNLYGDVSPLAIIEWDMNTRVKDWNKRAETIFGFTKDEAFKQHASDLILTENSKEDVDKLWRLLYTKKGGSRSVNENRRKDGTLIVCDWYNSPITNEDGDVVGISSMVIDVSEKVKTEEELENSNARFKMLSELTIEGILIHKNGIILDVNPSFERLTQYSRKEIIGHNVIEIIVADEYKELASQSVENKIESPYEIKIRKKDGEECWVEVEAKNTFYKESEIRAVAIRDIEERIVHEKELKKALFEAQESDRLKSAFLSTISHELRTPLNAVLGFSDLIDESMDIEEAVPLAKMIFQSGNHLLEIINDIFDLSMIEDGNVVVYKDAHNLHDLFDEIKEHIDLEKQKLNKDKLKISYRFDSKDKDLEIFTDHKRFKQIFYHLLKNAIKYTLEGSIEVGYSLHADAYKFYVKDTGIGISKDRQKEIFKIFRQLDDRHIREFEGLGIGLSIAQKLCENLGGEMSLDSTIGEGSTFYFTIPLLKTLGNK